MNPRRHGRAYRRLLIAYPRRFRRRYADEMTIAFEQAAAEAGDRGLLALVGLWVTTAWDLIRLGLLARWEGRTAPRGPTSASPIRRLRWSVGTDLRVSLRQIVRDPGASVAIIIALALGIGLTTTAFSVVYGSVWRGLPFEEPGRLIHFSRGHVGEPGNDLAVSHHDYLDWRAQQTTFEDLGAFVEALVHLTDGAGPAERQVGVSISPAALRLLRVTPALGRPITDADTMASAPPVVLISHDLWRRRYGSDSSVVGRRVVMSGVSTEIIGVMPPGFGFPIAEHIWLPLKLELGARGTGRLDVFGRLRPGVSLAEARREFAIISERLARAYPANAGIDARLATFREEYLGDEFVRSMYAILIGAGFMLLVACANVSNLLLTRLTRRQRELAVRTALGASRGRLISQLFWETLALAGAGGLLGLALGLIGVRWFGTAWTTHGGYELPHGSTNLFWWNFSVDTVPALFVLATTLAAALVAGTIPMLRGSDVDVAATLKDEGRTGTGRRAGRLARTLVIVEVAASTALLAAAGLTIKSVLNTTRVGDALAASPVFTARMSLPDPRFGLADTRYADDETRFEFWRRLIERIEQDARVRTAAVTTALPVTRARGVTVDIDGRDSAEGDQVRVAVVSEGFFRTFDVTSLAGRTFDQRDRSGTEPVAVVSESFARRFLPAGNPLFSRVRLRTLDPAAEPWLTVVGVVPDLWMDGPQNRIPEGVYLPFDQALIGSPFARLGPWGLAFMDVAVASRSGAPDLTDAVRDAVSSVDPAVPVYGMETMAGLVDRSVGRYRVYGTFYLTLGMLALTMALIGLYSVISFGVAGRTTEIGIRMALGAAAPRLVRRIVSEGVVSVITGIGVGLLMAHWLTAGLRQVLYEVEPGDPTVLVLISSVFVLTGMVAAYIPARRAAHVDPVRALR